MEELKALNSGELRERLEKARADLYRARVQLKSGQLKDNAVLGRVRKLVARILTLLEERETQSGEEV